MTYTVADGRTVLELEDLLYTVYVDYPEYSDGDFLTMVKKFAGDNFYKLHLVAKEYLNDPYLGDKLWLLRLKQTGNQNE